MTNEQIFLAEQRMDPQELKLFQDLHDNRNDQGTRNAYVDYLIDQNRMLSAELVRDCRILPKVATLPPGVFASSYSPPTRYSGSFIRTGEFVRSIVLSGGIEGIPRRPAALANSGDARVGALTPIEAARAGRIP